MRLDAWCKANPKRAAKLQEKLGRKTFHKYRSGNVTRVDPETADVIVEVTDHVVTPNDFYGIDPVKAARAAMAAAA